MDGFKKKVGTAALGNASASTEVAEVEVVPSLPPPAGSRYTPVTGGIFLPMNTRDIAPLHCSAPLFQSPDSMWVLVVF